MSVIALARGDTSVERLGNERSWGDRVALLAHYSQVARVSRSFRALVGAFAAESYRVVVVSSATCAGPLDWGDVAPGDITVIRKPNVGYDFGSWAIALARFPEIARAEYVVLANDSLVGPFASMSKLFSAFHSSPADVWGLTETLQFSRHLQSFFVGYRGGVLRDEPLARFWREIRHFDDKDEVIHLNEIGLGRLLFSEGYAVDAAFPAGQVVGPADNPTIIGWRTLLERGMPVVKRELVRSPHLAEDGADIRAEVRRRYGADVAEWL